MVFEDTPLGLKRKKGRAKPLTLDQKLDIVNRAIVDGEAQMDLAKDFRVSPCVICLLVKKVRKKPGYLRELISERTEKQLLDLRLAEFIEARMALGVQLRTVKQMRDDFVKTTGITMKEHHVRNVMRDQLDLRYRKIGRLAPKANSIANLIQRQ